MTLHRRGSFVYTYTGSIHRLDIYPGMRVAVMKSRAQVTEDHEENVDFFAWLDVVLP